MLAALLGCSSAIFAQEHPAEGDDSDLTALSLEDLMDLEFEIPMSVLGAHTHHEGEYMIGFTTSYVKMGGSRNGTRRVSDSDLLKKYATVHTEMRIRTNALTLMYAPSDDTTLVTMVPHVRKESRHRRSDGTRFKETSDGLGDVQFHTLHVFHREGAHRLHFDAGLSVPTGSIDIKNDGQREHYMQQLGSGTFDLRPGLTYLGETEDLAWGAQVNSVLRLGENDRDYTLGNRYGFTTWITPRLTDNLAVSLRLNAQHWGRIDGEDKALDRTAISENNPGHYGGDRIDLLGGVNFYGTEGFFEGQRIEFEAGWPIYQSLNGPQLETDFVVMGSWKVVF